MVINLSTSPFVTLHNKYGLKINRVLLHKFINSMTRNCFDVFPLLNKRGDTKYYFQQYKYAKI